MYTYFLIYESHNEIYMSYLNGLVVSEVYVNAHRLFRLSLAVVFVRRRNGFNF